MTPRRRQRRRLRPGRFISTTLLVAFALLVGLAAVQEATGRWRVSPVLSGSMRPGFAVGGVVIAERVPVTTLAAGDVIIFRRPDAPEEQVVHRIVLLEQGASGPIIQTKGDNNPVEDTWRVTLRGTTAYQVRYAVPAIGYPAVWIHRPDVRRYSTLAAGLLALVAAAVVFAPQRRPNDASGDAPANERVNEPIDEPSGASH